MNIINYDPSLEDIFTQEKIKTYMDPYKTYNKTNWGQMAMDLLEENRKRIQEIRKKHNLPLMPEHHIKEDFYVVKLDNADWNNLYLVKARNVKEAVDKVWTQCVEPINEDDDYTEPYYKHELHARRIDDYFKETTESVICLQ